MFSFNCIFVSERVEHFFRLKLTVMASQITQPVTLEDAKTLFKEFFNKKVTHKSLGESTLIGYRTECDLHTYPEFYIRTKDNKRYWVLPMDLYFDLK
jgi:hypothetical protein